MGDRWGPEGPPAEAYERVSDPERFRGLHVAGRALLDELHTRYHVDGEDLLDEDRPHGPEPARRLVPVADPATSVGAASFGMTFTEAPGVVLRWSGQERVHLPYCACDACDETLAENIEAMRGWADMVVGGTFGETLTIEGDRWCHTRWSATSTGSRSDTRLRVDEVEATRLLAEMPDGEQRWRHWPLRPAVTPGGSPTRRRGGPSSGRVRVWDDRDGWGVVDGPDTPGGCWTHWSDLRPDPDSGRPRRLQPGQPVIVSWEEPGQDDWPYRATHVSDG